MKHKILFAALLFALFTGCKVEEPEAEPVAKFTSSINGKTVTFTNQSLNAKSYYWTFGDGSASSEKNPVKKYSNAGTYTVTLKATNITKTSIYTKTINIGEDKPVAKFTYTKNELKVILNNQSTNATSYAWNFGNGQTSTSQNPTITYATDGTYTISLTAKKGTLSDTYSQQVSVAASAPNSSFSYKVDQPLKVILTNTSSGATSYLWDFGDGATSAEKNPTHKYSGIGVYKIKLTAKNTSGKTSISEKNVTIEAPTKCYITGFTINKIPVNNCYYQVQLTDDYAVLKSTYFYTAWYLLSSVNIPFHHDLNTPKNLNTNSTYVLRLYKNTSKPSGQADGKGFWTTMLTPLVFSTYPEEWSITHDETAMSVQLLWE